ncbi:MAG: hypothetical protein JWO69_1434 [Thermoleophilia bacterium]|nr:hypothetical protein [Thermoleophilia bacterium]
MCSCGGVTPLVMPAATMAGGPLPALAAPMAPAPLPLSLPAANATAGAGALGSALPVAATTSGGGGGLSIIRNAGQAGTQGSGDNVVRDAARAESNRQAIYGMFSQWDTQAKAEAAGWHLVPGSTNHFTRAGQTNGSDKPGAASSIIFEGGKLVGVQILGQKGDPMHDYGAGLWHTHGGATDEPMMHVWFDRPLANAYGG